MRQSFEQHRREMRSSQSLCVWFAKQKGAVFCYCVRCVYMDSELNEVGTHERDQTRCWELSKILHKCIQSFVRAALSGWIFAWSVRLEIKDRCVAQKADTFWNSKIRCRGTLKLRSLEKEGNRDVQPRLSRSEAIRRGVFSHTIENKQNRHEAATALKQIDALENKLQRENKCEWKNEFFVPNSDCDCYTASKSISLLREVKVGRLVRGALEEEFFLSHEE